MKEHRQRGPAWARCSIDASAEKEFQPAERGIQRDTGVATGLPWRHQSGWRRELARRAEWSVFQSLSVGLSSWADVNQDGFTNQTDLDIIDQNFGPCPN